MNRSNAAERDRDCRERRRGAEARDRVTLISQEENEMRQYPAR